MTTPTETQRGLFEAENAAAARAELVEKLASIARRIAQFRDVTVADLRVEAVKEGLLPSKGDGKELSFLGAVMKKAGLHATDRTVRSTVEGTHGNRNTVWTLTPPQE